VSATEVKPTKPAKGGNWMLYLVIAVCATPVILSYLTYYVIKPERRNNYRALIEPRQYPIPDLGSVALDGKPATLGDYRGKWILLQVDAGACEKRCVDKLYYQRQLRLTQGKERERIERVWLVTDAAPLSTVLMKEYDGTGILRVDAKKLAAWLPLDAGTKLEDHLFIIDPLGNLMMRFPKDPDYNKVKKDITRLLRASGIG
jgi:hypothetical protein